MKTIRAKRSVILDAFGDKALAMQGIYLSHEAMVDRAVYPFQDAKGAVPSWMETCARAVVKAFFNEVAHAGLLDLVRQCLRSEEKAQAVLVVLASPDFKPTLAAYWTLQEMVWS